MLFATMRHHRQDSATAENVFGIIDMCCHITSYLDQDSVANLSMVNHSLYNVCTSSHAVSKWLTRNMSLDVLKRAPHLILTAKPSVSERATLIKDTLLVTSDRLDLLRFAMEAYKSSKWTKVIAEQFCDAVYISVREDITTSELEAASNTPWFGLMAAMLVRDNMSLLKYAQTSTDVLAVLDVEDHILAEDINAMIYAMDVEWQCTDNAMVLLLQKCINPLQLDLKALCLHCFTMYNNVTEEPSNVILCVNSLYEYVCSIGVPLPAVWVYDGHFCRIPVRLLSRAVDACIGEQFSAYSVVFGVSSFLIPDNRDLETFAMFVGKGILTWEDITFQYLMYSHCGADRLARSLQKIVAVAGCMCDSARVLNVALQRVQFTFLEALMCDPSMDQSRKRLIRSRLKIRSVIQITY